MDGSGAKLNHEPLCCFAHIAPQLVKQNRRDFISMILDYPCQNALPKNRNKWHHIVDSASPRNACYDLYDVIWSVAWDVWFFVLELITASLSTGGIAQKLCWAMDSNEVLHLFVCGIRIFLFAWFWPNMYSESKKYSSSCVFTRKCQRKNLVGSKK